MRCSIIDGKLAIFDCYEQKDFVKSYLGAIFNKANKSWVAAANKENVKLLRDHYKVDFDDSVLSYFGKRATTEQVIKKLKNEDVKLKYDFSKVVNAKLMQHQLVAGNIAMALYDNKASGVMFSMEMGTGKTLSAIATIGELRKQGNIDKVLIVCPKVAMKVWEDEFEKFVKGLYDYEVVRIAGTPKQKINKFNYLIEFDGLQIAIINYEYVYAFSEILDKWRPDMIICDESHRIKTPSSNQTKAITKLGNKAKYKMCLTGTPLTNNILDFFSQFRFLDGSVFGYSFTNYKAKYVITGMFNEYLRPNPRNFKELIDKVDSISYRVRKTDCLDLPEFSDIVVPIEMDDKSIKIYKQFEKDFVAWLNENTTISAENALAKTLRLRQITGGFCYDEEGNIVEVSKNRLESCMDIVKELTDAGEQVIVFAEFKSEILAIRDACMKAGISCGTYYGETKDKDRDALVDAFQAKQVQVFIGQIESAGISITLTSSSHMIFYSTGYKYGVYDQARSRIHRKGQVNKCTYYHLMCENTIDQGIIRALQNKEALAKSVIDAYKNM